MQDIKIKTIKELNNLLITIIDYINTNYKIDENEIKNIIYSTKYYFIHGHNELAINDFIEIDQLLKIDTSKYMHDNKINFDEIYNKYYFIFLSLDNAFIKKEFINNHYYEKLSKEKMQGKIFKKEDLTKELLYELFVKEGIIKANIADLFNITKEQLTYLQKKYNLTNCFLKSSVDYPLESMKKINNNEFLDNSISNRYLYYLILKDYKGLKGEWKTENYISYMEERIKGNFNNYNITFKEYDNNEKGIKQKRKNNGRKINQRKAFESRHESGKIGENIVYNYEVQKLKSWHYNELCNKVKLIPRTKNSDITYDGTGYDIISYNKNKEKIYIEVKTSITNHTGIPQFFITQAEMRIINGEVSNINKENYFIYYVYNIDRLKKKANVNIINYDKFNSLKKEPILYYIHE